ncbi:hypothetical protein ACFSC4_28470 [Deinococcus malanensis]|uniref:hypothetical protein n=1 Tax=Deinococcus malanensis TaxID=1706855 RepID=UPI00364164F2
MGAKTTVPRHHNQEWRMTMQSLAATALAATLVILGTAGTGADAWPWMNPTLSPDQRADLVLRQMTPDEKQRLVFGSFATDLPAKFYRAPREARYGSAGYVPGIPRLGLPPQWQTDAGIGVATQGSAPKKLERTALPPGSQPPPAGIRRSPAGAAR